GRASQRESSTTTGNAWLIAVKGTRDANAASSFSAAVVHRPDRRLARAGRRDAEHAYSSRGGGNVVAAVLVGRGEFVAAGILVLAASALDMLDGALARATRRATDFGSVFDAVADRVSEAAVLFGLLVYFGDIGRTEDQQLTFVAVVASLLVSYIRARAEIVGVELREGLLSRAPRVLLISAGLILEPYWD